MFETPILLLVFNRPAHTRKMWEVIRQLKPKNLYVVGDGARNTHHEDAGKCQQVQAIFQEIDWDCNFRSIFRQENEGCGRGVANAISWFFSQVPYGIILEDDCLPDASFFPFCAEMLQCYAENQEVMFISGNCRFAPNDLAGKESSYHFLRTSGIWGWATWQRAWQNFDYEMQDFETSLPAIKALFSNKEAEIWEARFREIYKQNRQDVWDYQWHYSVFKHEGLCIVPNVNLVQNVGFDEEATHTKNDTHILASFQKKALHFPIKHPKKIILNISLDQKRWQIAHTMQNQLHIFLNE